MKWIGGIVLGGAMLGSSLMGMRYAMESRRSRHLGVFLAKVRSPALHFIQDLAFRILVLSARIECGPDSTETWQDL
jgi:hypothetical protein